MYSFNVSLLLVSFILLACNFETVSTVLELTACQRLLNHKTKIEAIGYYGGTKGTDRFLVITNEKTVWDQDGREFNPYTKIVTLQELADFDIQRKWLTLRENLVNPDVNHRTAIIRMFFGVNFDDWLFFAYYNLKSHFISLTHQNTGNQTSFWVEEDLLKEFLLVSAVPSGRLYVIGPYRFFGRYLTTSPLCLFTINMTLKTNFQPQSFPSWFFKKTWDPVNYQRIACFEKNLMQFGNLQNHHFFMDGSNRLYAVDNLLKTVTVIIIQGEDLKPLIVISFYDFFSCGYKWIMVIILVLMLLVGLIGGYIWYYNKKMMETEMQNQQMKTLDEQSMRMRALKSANMVNAFQTTFGVSPSVATTTTPQHFSQFAPKTRSKKTKSKKIPSGIRLKRSAKTA